MPHVGPSSEDLSLCVSRFLTSLRAVLLVSLSHQVRSWQLFKCKPACRALPLASGLCSFRHALRLCEPFPCRKRLLLEALPPHGAQLNKAGLCCFIRSPRAPLLSFFVEGYDSTVIKEGTFAPDGFVMEAGCASSASGSLAGIISEVKSEGQKVWQRSHCSGWRRQFSLREGRQ